MRKFWQELWWAMAGGNVGEYERLQRLEIVEFWALADLWEKKIQREIDNDKAKGG